MCISHLQHAWPAHHYLWSTIPPSIYAGDFNCHHTEWGYSRSINDGICLVEWASANNLTLLFNPNPDLAFASGTEDQAPHIRRVLEKFLRSQHRPSLITPVPLLTPTSSKPVRRWNFRKADWDKFKLLTNKAARTQPPLEDTDLDTSY